MWTKINDQLKKLMSKCDIINEICKIAKKNFTLKENLITSL